MKEKVVCIGKKPNSCTDRRRYIIIIGSADLEMFDSKFLKENKHFYKDYRRIYSFRSRYFLLLSPLSSADVPEKGFVKRTN